AQLFCGDEGQRRRDDEWQILQRNDELDHEGVHVWVGPAVMLGSRRESDGHTPGACVYAELRRHDRRFAGNSQLRGWTSRRKSPLRQGTQATPPPQAIPPLTSATRAKGSHARTPPRP